MPKRIEFFPASIALCMALLLLYLGMLAFTNFHVVYASYIATHADKKGVETSWQPMGTTFPHMASIGDIPTRHAFNIHIMSGQVIPAYLSIMVDRCLDSVTINTFPVELPKPLCGYGTYFDIPTNGKIVPGENQIDITVSDPGKTSPLEGNFIQLSLGNVWPGGMRVELPIIIGFAVVCLLLVLGSKLGRTVADPVIATIFAMGLVFYAYRLIWLPFVHFADYYPHLEYIQYLYFKHRLPDPLHGFETFQSPIYYLITLPFYYLGELIGAGNPVELVRCPSIAGYLVFLLYAVATIRLLVQRKSLVYLATLLLVLWPSGMTQAVKINNDVVLFPLVASSIYYLIRWQQQQNKNDALRACALALLSMGTKSTGLWIVGAVGVTILFHAWATKTSLRTIFSSRKAIMALVVIALFSVGINFGRTSYAALSSQTPRHLLVPNASQEKSEKSWSDFWNDREAIYNLFVGFDLERLIKRPFDLPKNVNERLFWNMLHMLFVLNMEAHYQPMAASISMGLYLGMITYAGICAIFMFRRSARQWNRWYWLGPTVVLVLGIIGLMYSWALMRYEFNCVDARYIYFCVPWLIALFAASIEWFRAQGNRILSNAGIVLGIALAISFFGLLLGQTYLAEFSL